MNIGHCSNYTETRARGAKLFSLFSIVQFPNEECTSLTTSSTFGTCYSTSDCTSRGGSADGTCAAGFGVCCVITMSTCGGSISTNTTYIQNPGYPTAYTPATTGTCAYTISKVSDNICTLRLDFQTFSGFATSTATAGTCSDTFVAAGQSGVNPPTICGTNTDYHMYVEFGASATDSITLTNTWASTTSGKSYNILTRQIACDASWKPPTDCVQYFTGISNSVKSYNFAGGQLLAGQGYTNCIRTEKGYCSIQWKESSTTSPDPFGLMAGTATGIGANGGNLCANTYVHIPNLSPNGIAGIPVLPTTATAQAFQNQVCGVGFGVEQGTTGTVPSALVSIQKPFVLGVYTNAPGTALTANVATGFNLDYTQLAC